MIRLIDSHCHLVSYKFPSEEIPTLIQNAIDAGVDRIIATGTEVSNWDSYLSIAKMFPDNVFPSLGIHPTDVHEAPEEWYDLLLNLAVNKEIVALGETGLDYYHNPPEGWDEASFHFLQKEFLRKHFEIAKQTGLNVVIHTRDKKGSASFDDALQIAQEFAGQVRAMFHCFIGTKEQAQQVLDINGVLSFTGILTFKNAPDVLEVATWCPENHFLLETDAPYLAPTPFRGQRNEPAYVKEIAEKLAIARNTSLENIAKWSTKTAKCFFSL